MARLFGMLAVLIGAFPFAPFAGAQEMRFPAPEFQGEYQFPPTAAPEAVSWVREWTDVGVLALALGVASWLAVRKRSRRGIFLLMLFCLLYFGFYKQGCVCPIGSIQNVALSIFHPQYAIPMTVLLIFLLPLLFALFTGRVFCSSVCALGAIQDLVLLKPVRISSKWALALGMIPFVYLGTAVLLAATNTGFIVCRYDPFVGFFRLNGNAPYLFLGAAFLAAGVFIARPYCRFACPYGVLLGWMSAFSRWHLSITPTECVQCRLCENSCPFDSINKPNLGLEREKREAGARRLGYLLLLIPALVVFGGWTGHLTAKPLSRYNNQVALAERVLLERADSDLEPILETDTFRSMGLAEEELFRQARTVQARMDVGGWLLGGFLGLAFGLKLIRASRIRSRRDYEVDRVSCFSCARCCSYCPNDEENKMVLVSGRLSVVSCQWKNR